MHLFYTPEITGDKYQLNEEESKHCIRVLRLKQGDIIHLADGKGNLFETSIIAENPKHCIVGVNNVQHEYLKRNFHLHISIAPTKNLGRIEWFLEKATEIGIDEITPLFCQHSERGHIKIERLEKVMIAAMKQSLKAYLPKLNEPVSFAKLTGNTYNGGKFIAYCEDEGISHLKDVYKPGSDALILIGPEGDFSKEEIMEAKNAGFIPITLGKSRLRTETAGVVVCTILNTINEQAEL